MMQAAAQQAADTLNEKPLKGTTQTSKGSGKPGVLTSRTALALGAGAVVFIVAAAVGITWYRAGMKACPLFIAYNMPLSCEAIL